MIKKRIAYLHNHTNKSIKDALPTVNDYNKKIKEFKDNGIEITGLAISEHGNMYSYIDHYVHSSENTNAIIADEIYHCEDRNIADDKERYHMVLLAKTQDGLHNVFTIASDSGMHKVHGRTKDFDRTEDRVLEKYGKGIIALSGCIAGIIPTLILNGQYDKAKEKALYYKSIFDDFYLEVQPHDIPEQLLVNKDLVKMSKETGIGLVITTDTHYINKEDKKYHDLLKKIDHLNPFSVEAYLKSYDELVEYCNNNNIPLSAIENTNVIAEQCKVNPLPTDSKGLLRDFTVPEGYTEETYLREITFTCLWQNIEKHNFTDIQTRIDRINYELDVICTSGFSGYFLILWDWFKWCRENDILLGPGRGSGAGSLVCYVLGITHIDPIKNNFIFERFMSLERLSFPDIDRELIA